MYDKTPLLRLVGEGFLDIRKGLLYMFVCAQINFEYFLAYLLVSIATMALIYSSQRWPPQENKKRKWVCKKPHRVDLICYPTLTKGR
jgi:hypothetical protein